MPPKPLEKGVVGNGTDPVVEFNDVENAVADKEFSEKKSLRFYDVDGDGKLSG